MPGVKVVWVFNNGVFSLFVCFNSISYRVAQSVIKAEGYKSALILYDEQRVAKMHDSVGVHLRIGARSHQLIYLLAKLRLIRQVFQPHMKITASRLKKALINVPTLHYLDDGLDTQRHVPSNFDLAKVNNGSRYYSFKEYGVFPEWMRDMDVRKVAGLSDFAVSRRKGVPFPSDAHVLVESPGLDLCLQITRLQNEGIRPIVVRHPSRTKRQNLNFSEIAIWRGSGDLDADIAASQGAHIHIGETMSLLIGWYGSARMRNHWYIHLTPQQRGNLIFVADIMNAQSDSVDVSWM